MTPGLPRILIADDQPDNLLILEDLLGAEFAVHSCRNGSEVLAYFATGGTADLVLLDVVMPGPDGFELCRWLKDAPATCDMPVIFLTGVDSEAREEYALSLGAADFIHKPISPAVVLARVRVHLRLSQTARQLRQRNEDLERLAISTAGIGIWDYDIPNDRATWSPEMFRLYGVVPERFGGRYQDWLALVHPEDARWVVDRFQNLVAGSTEYDVEYRIIRPDLTLRVVRANGIVRRDASGTPLRVLGTAWDVTDYRQALDQLKVAKEQAEAANAAKTTFLATMSHELRTPLNAIIGFGQWMYEKETRPDWRSHLEIICQAGSNLLRLVQSILDFSKIEAGKVEVAPQPFDPRTELSEIIRMFRPEAIQKGILMNLRLGAGVPERLSGDQGLLRQVLVNLIGNALKFTPHGRIDVSADVAEIHPEHRQATILFQVIDTGIGIRQENQDRIFEMFEQEDNSLTRRFGGSGLGLAISRRLVALLGGRLWLNSTPDVGSRFSFTVPFGILPAQPAVPSAAPQLRPGAVDGARRILIAEDDLFSRQLLVKVVEDQGHQVATAVTGEEALRLAAAQPFDLILMDIQLPELSGIEATRRIRAGTVDGCNPALPIIAVTAYAMRGDRERFLGEGVTDYISKPINLSQLVGLLQRHLPPVPGPGNGG